MQRAFGQTDVGKTRTVNQDAIFVSTAPVGPLRNLFVVADGMGGHNAGEIASGMAIEHFCRYLWANEHAAESPLDLLTAAAAEANRQVLALAQEDPSRVGMGTTLTGCTVYEDKCAFVHVGDSRAYAVSKGKLTQLTHDHSYVYEMVLAGQLTEDEARTHSRRNVLTRALGVGLDLSADGYIHDKPDIILLCSDGLYNMVPPADILQIVTANNGNAVPALIDAANAGGGTDNISVITVYT